MRPADQKGVIPSERVQILGMFLPVWPVLGRCEATNLGVFDLHQFALLKQGCANSGGFGARWRLSFPPEDPPQITKMGSPESQFSGVRRSGGFYGNSTETSKFPEYPGSLERSRGKPLKKNLTLTLEATQTSFTLHFLWFFSLACESSLRVCLAQFAAFSWLHTLQDCCPQQKFL